MITLAEFIKFDPTGEGSHFLFVPGSSPRLIWIVKRRLHTGHPDEIFKGRLLLEHHERPPNRSYVTIDEISNGDYVKGKTTKLAYSVRELERTLAPMLARVTLGVKC